MICGKQLRSGSYKTVRGERGLVLPYFLWNKRLGHPFIKNGYEYLILTFAEPLGKTTGQETADTLLSD